MLAPGRADQYFQTFQCCSRQIFDIDVCEVCIIFQSLFIPFLLISDKGIMAQPDIKQEPLSPTDRILPSCSQEGEMEEVKCCEITISTSS